MQDTQPAIRHSFCKATDCRHNRGTRRDLGARKGIVKRRGRGLLRLSSRFPGLGDLFDCGDPRLSRADRITLLVSEEGCKVHDCLVFIEAKIVVEQEEQLFFHEVYLREIEKRGISRPVLVFGRGVVEIFCSNDESGQEDTVSRTRHACKSGIRTSGL